MLDPVFKPELVTRPAAMESAAAPLAAPLSATLRRNATSLLLGHPWFDDVGLRLLKRYFFPLSRLWALAHPADGSLQQYRAALPSPSRLDNTAAIAQALSRFEARRATSAALDAAWEQVFFGPHDHPLSYREAIEQGRIAHRHAFNATRRHFWPLLDRDVPAVRLDIQTPEATAAVFRPALADLKPFTCPPARMPAVAVSRSVRSVGGIDTWVRFKSPSARLGDTVTARVSTPVGVLNPPTLIFGHGVCVEFDHWQGLVDEVGALVKGGIRVIRPEAPWHGRRAPSGYFGGERLIATFPMGLLDALTGAVQEWAVLAHWARTTSSGPIAFGGTSLGALTAQFAADRARDWQDDLKPEALFLITHCGHVSDAVQHGALARIWGGPEATAAKGWTEDLAAPYLGLLDPVRRPVVKPSAIVSVLGRRDVVTPFSSGRAAIEDWCVPAENAFLLDRGHFSVPMTLLRETAPVRRFIEVLADVR